MFKLDIFIWGIRQTYMFARIKYKKMGKDENWIKIEHLLTSLIKLQISECLNLTSLFKELNNFIFNKITYKKMLKLNIITKGVAQFYIFIRIRYN